MFQSNYAYATGLIRALEPKLLDRTDLERMIDAKDAGDAFKVFNDTDYADNLLDVEAREFERALDCDQKQTKDLFFQIVPNKNLLKFLFLEFDFHNIKILLKAKFLEESLENLLLDFGTQDLETLKKYILAGEKEKIISFELKGKLDQEIKEIIDEALKKFEKEPNPHKIDAFLDKEYFTFKKFLSKELKNDFLEKLTIFEVDLANLKIFFRSKSLERQKEEVKDEFIESGNISVKDLLVAYEQNLEDSLKFLAKYLDKKVKQALEGFLKNRYLWRIEKILEEIELEILRKSKYISYGPEVVTSYYWAKKNANNNVRLVMKGKINGIEREEIRERVREIY